MNFHHLEKIRSLAVVGATGIVGKEFLEILSEYKLKIPHLKLLASGNSAGTTVQAGDESYLVEELKPDSFEDIDVAFFSVPTSVCSKFIPHAVEAGSIVIDDSSCYRMESSVPLIVPQVNGTELREFDGNLLATPNCSTAPLALCLKPLLDNFGIRRVLVSTYQAVSGAGSKAYEELSQQTVALMNGLPVDSKVFPHRIAFNCLPMIGPMLENGSSEEEEKVVRESRKILGVPDLRVSCTAVRVPTFCGHGLSVNVELEEDFSSVEEVQELLDGFDGLKLLDNPDSHVYPTNVECIKSQYTFVGRVRRDYSVKSGLNFWVITDNLRKGAALNVLETLETLYAYRSMN